MNKRGVDSEAELPIFKKMDFGDDKATVIGAIEDFSQSLIISHSPCAEPDCSTKVHVPRTFCLGHSRWCFGCERQLCTPAALRYATRDHSVGATFYRLSVQPPRAYCSDCITKHQRLPEMPCGDCSRHLKHPLVVVECEIGATGQQSCEVRSVCAQINCTFCTKPVVLGTRGCVPIIGGAVACSDCASVDYPSCKPETCPTLDIGFGVRFCSSTCKTQ